GRRGGRQAAEAAGRRREGGVGGRDGDRRLHQGRRAGADRRAAGHGGVGEVTVWTGAPDSGGGSVARRGLNATTASGGSVIESMNSRPWQATASASTPPRLPWPLPP